VRDRYKVYIYTVFREKSTDTPSADVILYISSMTQDPSQMLRREMQAPAKTFRSAVGDTTHEAYQPWLALEWGGRAREKRLTGSMLMILSNAQLYQLENCETPG
jgi:predicted metalloendopeptidase